MKLVRRMTNYTKAAQCIGVELRFLRKQYAIAVNNFRDASIKSGDYVRLEVYANLRSGEILFLSHDHLFSTQNYLKNFRETTSEGNMP